LAGHANRLDVGWDKHRLTSMLPKMWALSYHFPKLANH
jgi:hypothetical protein